MWKPKRREVSEQCVSCPFREGNDAEFGEVIGKLRKALGMAGEVTDQCVKHARKMVRLDLAAGGDFICHKTAYDAEMKMAGSEHHRQCKGATAYFVKCSHNPKSGS